MIKSITVTNFLGEQIKMELTNPWESGFYVKSIDGLGPTTANINITDLSGTDGGVFNSSRAQTKNIVINLGFLENPDIETTRHLSYKYFPIKKKLTLTVETDYRTASIDGYVESNTPDIFSQDESNQVSILCPSPYFYSEDNITVFSGIEQLFEFPFENPALHTDLIEMGAYSNDFAKEIWNDGDVDTGIRCLIHCLGSIENISIINATSREVMEIDTSKIPNGLGAGDELLISTIKGDRYVTLQRDGVFYNVLNALDKDTDWPQMYRGKNVFRYMATSGMTNAEFRILNNVLYEGM